MVDLDELDGLDGLGELVVVILDYDAGNLRSVVRAVERVGARPEVASVPAALDNADVVILPGVGAAADTMRNLRERDLVEPLREYIAADRPFLGVCMGLQALMTASDEGGDHACLDVLPGRVVRLPSGQKVPHMGWNRVWPQRESPLFDGIPAGSYFYFVHSYYCDLSDAGDILATTDYGVLRDRRRAALQPRRDPVSPREERRLRAPRLPQLPHQCAEQRADQWADQHADQRG